MVEDIDLETTGAPPFKYIQTASGLILDPRFYLARVPDTPIGVAYRVAALYVGYRAYKYATKK